METISNNELNNKILDLGKKICEVKGFNIENYSISNMAEKIYYYSIWFNDYYEITKLDYDDKKIILESYDFLLKQIELYKEMKKRIEIEGFEKIENYYKEKLKELFIQMLDYKNRNYNKNANLIELLEEIDLCYHDYKYDWTSLYQMLKGKCNYKSTIRDDLWKVPADNVEYISELEDIYKYFSEEPTRYKKYEQYYEDITLQEGQTLEDLYNEEKQKLYNLYIEILQYNYVRIEDTNNLSLMECNITKIYPKFENTILHLNSVENDIYSSYMDDITEIRKTYKYLHDNYKK